MRRRTKEVLIFLGLLLEVIGVVIIAWGAIRLTPDDAVPGTLPMFDAAVAKPSSRPTVSVWDRAANARWGMSFVAAGLALQAVAWWPRRGSPPRPAPPRTAERAFRSYRIRPKDPR